MKKLQSADWSTEEAGEEGPSSLCVGVFTPVSKDQQSAIVEAVHDVEMDCQLNNPAHARSAIGKTLHSSYKINSVQDATKTLASMLATFTNLADWKPNRSSRPTQPKIVAFLEQVIKKLVSQQGRDWIFKFKTQRHIGISILAKVQRIVSKLALAAGDPDVEQWNFDEGPMPHNSNSDLQEAFHLMAFFIQDLHRAVIGQELSTFSEVPPLYTVLYPPASAPSGRGSDRNKPRDEATTGNRTGGGGGAGGGSGGASKGGHDLRTSRSANGDARNTNRDKPDKDKGIFIIDIFPYFVSKENRNGVPLPPKVTVDGKEVILCMKGSSRGKVCPKAECRFAHLLTIDKITKGLSQLNTWTVGMNGVKWCTPAVATQAANAKATVLKEDTGKKEE